MFVQFLEKKKYSDRKGLTLGSFSFEITHFTRKPSRKRISGFKCILYHVLLFHSQHASKSSATVGGRSANGARKRSEALTSDQVSYRESTLNFKCLTGAHIQNRQEVRPMTKSDAQRNSGFIHANEMIKQLWLPSS